MEIFRKIFGILTVGIVWLIGILVFFVFSGAQGILANPVYQSQKFIDAFTKEPLPLTGEDSLILPFGLIIVGIFVGIVFNFLNDKLNYGWFKKGLVFGLIHWAFMIPWFEFYLPFNVMREPFVLVLFEMFLWLCVTQTIGIYLSFVFNFKRNKS